MMDLSKLEVKQVIKNYNALCEIISVAPTKGKGRDYHIREFERYCTYHKEGQKFIVDEVFPIPKERIDKRVNNGGHIAHTKYDELMDNLIINWLKLEGSVDQSFNDIFQYEIPLLKSNYIDLLEHGYKVFAKKHAMSKGLVLTYSQKVRAIIQKSFETSLDRLKNRNVIEWKKNILTNNEVLGIEFADDEMVTQIKEAEQKVYDEMEITHFSRVNPKINKKFKKLVCELLECDRYGIISYWNVYSIELIDTDIQEVDSGEDDIYELIRRFRESVHTAVLNKNYKDDFGNKFKPFQNEIHIENTMKLTQMIWGKIPEDKPEDIQVHNKRYYDNQIPYDQMQFNDDVPF